MGCHCSQPYGAAVFDSKWDLTAASSAKKISSSSSSKKLGLRGGVFSRRRTGSMDSYEVGKGSNAAELEAEEAEEEAAAGESVVVDGHGLKVLAQERVAPPDTADELDEEAMEAAAAVARRNRRRSSASLAAALQYMAAAAAASSSSLSTTTTSAPAASAVSSSSVVVAASASSTSAASGNTGRMVPSALSVKYPPSPPILRGSSTAFLSPHHPPLSTPLSTLSSCNADSTMANSMAATPTSPVGVPSPLLASPLSTPATPPPLVPVPPAMSFAHHASSSSSSSARRWSVASPILRQVQQQLQPPPPQQHTFGDNFGGIDDPLALDNRRRLSTMASSPLLTRGRTMYNTQRRRSSSGSNASNSRFSQSAASGRQVILCLDTRPSVPTPSSPSPLSPMSSSSPPFEDSLSPVPSLTPSPPPLVNTPRVISRLASMSTFGNVSSDSPAALQQEQDRRGSLLLVSRSPSPVPPSSSIQAPASPSASPVSPSPSAAAMSAPPARIRKTVSAGAVTFALPAAAPVSASAPSSPLFLTPESATKVNTLLTQSAPTSPRGSVAPLPPTRLASVRMRSEPQLNQNNTNNIINRRVVLPPMRSVSPMDSEFGGLSIAASSSTTTNNTGVARSVLLSNSVPVSPSPSPVKRSPPPSFKPPRVGNGRASLDSAPAPSVQDANVSGRRWSVVEQEHDHERQLQLKQQKAERKKLRHSYNGMQQQQQRQVVTFDTSDVDYEQCSSSTTNNSRAMRRDSTASSTMTDLDAEMDRIAAVYRQYLHQQQPTLGLVQ